MWHRKGALNKMEAEMKGWESVCSCLVKHISALLPEGSIGRVHCLGLFETRLGRKRENEPSSNSVLANSYKVLVSFVLS